MGSLPQQIVLHELLQHDSITKAASSPDCCSMGHASIGCSPSSTSCFGVGLSLHGSSQDHSLLQSSPCSGVGLLHRLQVNICLPVVLHEWQGHICLTVVFTTGCKGISAPTPGVPPHPSPPTLVSAELFLTCFHPALLWPQLQLCNKIFYLPFKYVFHHF